MQNYKVIYTANALKELDEIAEVHLELVGINSARRIRERIRNHIAHLETAPYIGREKLIGGRKLRMLNCDVYICFYKVVNDAIEIHHIVDGRTDYIPRVLGMK